MEMIKLIPDEFAAISISQITSELIGPECKYLL